MKADLTTSKILKARSPKTQKLGLDNSTMRYHTPTHSYKKNRFIKIIISWITKSLVADEKSMNNGKSMNYENMSYVK